jgi:hypothetical protein
LELMCGWRELADRHREARWLLRAEARRPIRPHHRIVAKAIIEIAQTGEQIGPPSQE